MYSTITIFQDATWEPVISDGVGVSDDSEDDYGDPLSLATPSTVPAAAAGLDPDIIPIMPEEVDADGAPILSQLAALPIAPRPGSQPTAVTVNGTKPSAPKPARDEDFISDSELMPEDDFVDWNFSVKFFNFIRTPPETTELIPAKVAMVEIPVEKPPTPPPTKPKQIRVTAPASKPRGGRGRGKARGGATKARVKRVYDSDELEFSSDDNKAKPKAKPRGGARGGRGAAKAKAKAPAPAKKPRYRESSEEEESSENEQEVLKRPVHTSSRPSRNCRRSTNYADIEKSGDVLDFLLN